MYAGDMYFPTSFIRKVVGCVESATGDDIREDIQRNNLHTLNSTPARIWDLLNTNLVNVLDTEDGIMAKAHRGPWEMVVIFERTTRNIFTFMRERRFSEIRERQRRRKRMHYLDIVAKRFNKELLANGRQLQIFPHVFSDESRLEELVRTFLCDLEGNVSLVRHHVLVLFETVGYQLSHIRAVRITPTLDVAQEQDWTSYISAVESSVVEKVTHPKAPENQPQKGLTLKRKALERKKDKPQQKRHEQGIQKES